MRFKFETSGQGLDNALVVNQVLRGDSLKPLAPVNLKGSRNSNLDLIIEWTRRSRIGAGMRPSTDVPLSQETERYEIEVYSGSTLLRTWQVNVDQSEPVIWRPDPSLTLYTNGGINSNATGSSSIAMQPINGDAFVEGTIGTIATFPLTFGIEPNSAAIGALYYWGANGTNARAEGVASTEVTVATGDRFAIELIGNVARYYKNYSGSASVPVYSSGLSPKGGPYFVTIGMHPATTQGFISCFIRRQSASSVYTNEQQIADFGSAQSSIKVRVYQISSLVGRGFYAEAIL
jgi:hypothetical protein